MRYTKWVNDPSKWRSGLSPCEEEIKNFLATKWSVEKIKEDGVPRPDFLIRELKATIEVKCINTVPVHNLSEGLLTTNIKDEREWIDKLNLTLEDIVRKDTVDRDWYMGGIYIDQPQLFFSHYLVLEPGFIEKTDFVSQKIDGLLLYSQMTSDLSHNRKPIVVLKNKVLRSIFSKAYSSDIEIRLIQ